MEKEHMRIVEINGVKLEVDMRHAKVIDAYKIGDNVRVLVKSYGEQYTVHPGVIVGFDEFAKMPTICVAYIESGYNSADIKFININSSEKCETEIAPAHNISELHFKKQTVLGLFNKEIAAKQKEIEDIEMKKSYFDKYFSQYFTPKVEA